MPVLFKIPEAMENFTITLVKATGGARVGEIRSADLQIIKNDDPIFFSGEDTVKDVFLWRESRIILHSYICAEPVVVRLQEGAVANFTVLRSGRADFVATVMYRVEYGAASPGDFTMLSNDSLLVFDAGEWMKNISVALEDDNIPETDEPFYIVLYNATGEYRLHLKIGIVFFFCFFFICSCRCTNDNR